MEEEKPKLKDDFMIEYAKSGRSKCNHCKAKIAQESMRIGILTIAERYDGEYYSCKQVPWHTNLTNGYLLQGIM